MAMNRRLYRDSYVFGVKQADFFFGIPDYLAQVTSGSGALSTVDLSDPRAGSLKAVIGTGTSDAKLDLGVIDPTVVKAVCVDLIDVWSTDSNPWLQFGMLDAGLANYTIFDAGNGPNGLRLISQNASSTNRTFAACVAKQQFTGIDLGLEIDCVTQTSQAHIDHSWVHVTDTNDFPQVPMMLTPFWLRSTAGAAGENAELYVKQIKIEVYR